MASDPPPSGAPVQPVARPRYLVVALVAALVFGAGCWTEGCGRLQTYRGARDGGAAFNAQVHDEQERANVEALYKRHLEADDDARARGIPIWAATFVLGAALLALSARGLAGRTNARSALMQVVAVQAIVVVAQFFLMREANEAELDWFLAGTLAHQREALRPADYAFWAPILRGARHYGQPVWLAIRTVASALIIVALTQRRSREFFEAAVDTAPER